MPSSVAPGTTLRAPTAAPVNTLAGTLADPGDQARGARAKPEVAALLLARRPASHSLASIPSAGGLCQERPAPPWARTGTISLDSLLAGQLAGDCRCPTVALTCPGSGTLAPGERQRPADLAAPTV